MKKQLSWAIFRGLGRLGVRTRSESHQSERSHAPDPDAIPVQVVGFARTGTTTAQLSIARALAYNTSFEPFGINHAEIATFGAANRYFLGNPTSSQLQAWLSTGDIPAAVQAVRSPTRRAELEAVFHEHLDAVYHHYGRNVVCKEIRIVANIPALINYHRKRSLRVFSLGIQAHPFGPLYTYYRIGGLSRRDNPSGLRVEDLYRYRLATYESLDLFANVRRLPVRSAADCFLVSVLLDQAYLQYCCKQRDIDCVINLHQLPDRIDEIGERVGRVPDKSQLPKLRESHRFAGDVLFRQRVLNAVQGEIQEFVTEHYGSVSPVGVKGPGWRGCFTAIRHEMFQ